jgi:hypothetical protein
MSAASSLPATDAVMTTEIVMQHVGPYDVLSILSQNDTQRWLLGYDTRLLRKVWIRETPPGASAVAPALRNLARPTRLRWLQGHRGGETSWDAYEAVEGTPLLGLVQESQPWERVRRWLHDLASELDAASKDDTVPETLSLDRVWITASGGAKLLDSEVPADRDDTAPAAKAAHGGETPSAFLNHIAIAALEGRVPSAGEASTHLVQAPLPLGARETMGELVTPAPLSIVVERFKHLMKRPPEVSPWRRMAVLVCCAAPALAAGAFMGLGVIFSQSMMEKNPAAFELNPCLFAYEDMDKGVERMGLKDVSVPQAKAAMEIYVSGEFGDVIRDEKAWSNPFLKGAVSPQRRAVLEKMIAAHPHPSEEEFARAKVVLKPLLEQRISPKDGYMRYPGMGLFIVSSAFALLLVFIAGISVICAFAFRGGLILRMLGIAVVTRNGVDASRLRMLWRSIIAWLPVLLLPVVWLYAGKSYSGTGQVDYGQTFWMKTLYIVIITGVTGILALISVALRTRGLHDRAAGTWLVPR